MEGSSSSLGEEARIDIGTSANNEDETPVTRLLAAIASVDPNLTVNFTQKGLPRSSEPQTTERMYQDAAKHSLMLAPKQENCEKSQEGMVNANAVGLESHSEAHDKPPPVYVHACEDQLSTLVSWDSGQQANNGGQATGAFPCGVRKLRAMHSLIASWL